MSADRLHRRLVAESLGTALLVVMGPGAAAVDLASHGAVTHVGVSLAFAGAIALAIAVFGPVSGAHINPAVTFALSLDGGFPLRDVPLYVVAQCLGAVAGAAAIAAITGHLVAAAATTPAIATGSALAVETGLSAILMSAILAVRRHLHGVTTSAAVVGGTVGLCALVAGPLTGASMNPARTLGPAVLSGQWTAHWIYWLGPMCGMPLAVAAFRWLYPAPAIAPAPRTAGRQ